MTPTVFLGETLAGPTDPDRKATGMLAAAIGATTSGAIAALFGGREYAIGATATAVNSIIFLFEADSFCGMFASNEEKKRISEKLLPRKIGAVLGGGTAIMTSSVIGSRVMKKHPVVGAIAGAAIASAATMAFIPTECPEP